MNKKIIKIWIITSLIISLVDSIFPIFQDLSEVEKAHNPVNFIIVPIVVFVPIFVFFLIILGILIFIINKLISWGYFYDRIKNMNSKKVIKIWIIISFIIGLSNSIFQYFSQLEKGYDPFEFMILPIVIFVPTFLFLLVILGIPLFIINKLISRDNKLNNLWNKKEIIKIILTILAIIFITPLLIPYILVIFFMILDFFHIRF
ncbi:MAG: hypothetical protein NTU58_02170 [Candidatus Nealsonbacteria bacterium]|nr:hypothetical protein [Candidatus Nealsonbacteria bacterium]